MTLYSCVEQKLTDSTPHTHTVLCVPSIGNFSRRPKLSAKIHTHKAHKDAFTNKKAKVLSCVCLLVLLCCGLFLQALMGATTKRSTLSCTRSHEPFGLIPISLPLLTMYYSIRYHHGHGCSLNLTLTVLTYIFLAFFFSLPH